ncbi:MAG: 30S ribosome-binding factor RbfA [Deltaproteobacteria bacterium]|nr:30S ribosome-binding factor RbfA [Deltaproteobacteria bacterium]
MLAKRAERVAQQLRAELAMILATETRDPRIGALTVTNVVMSDDLGLAKIYLVAMGAQEVPAETMQGLSKAKGFIRKELAHRLCFRHIPDLVFFSDDTFVRGVKIEEILARIDQEKINDKRNS